MHNFWQCLGFVVTVCGTQRTQGERKQFERKEEQASYTCIVEIPIDPE